eukprot:TRINITY_DN7925_c4_g1_i1.p1 TRINITY_DN7925_c4_g1~~TRINITY_DN7925_c4_g1_i1.p1  ORF type:complete len:100 (+),score=29.50 TRINITY_DN7925_c4_g1_i1:48-302(+)
MEKGKGKGKGKDKGKAKGKGKHHMKAKSNSGSYWQPKESSWQPQESRKWKAVDRTNRSEDADDKTSAYGSQATPLRRRWRPKQR